MTSTAMRPAAPSGPVPEAPVPTPPPETTPSGLAGLLELPATAVRGVIRSARTTPGLLTVIAVGLVVLTLVTGLVGTIMVQQKSSTTEDLIGHREPLAAAAQEIYRSLSDADATAAIAFLITGTEPPELRSRYDQDIARAGAALSRAASDVSSDAAAKVNVINQQLPVYTGLVETARANNRLGYPVGASYLQEASNLMHATILPAAGDLYQIDTAGLESQQSDAWGFPWFAAVLLVGTLAALIATQVYLTRRTNRLLNVGLVVATGAMVLMLLWGSVALVVQAILVGNGQDDGSHPVDVLVRARAAAVQARGDETMTLVARGAGGDYEVDFQKLAPQFTGLLSEAKGLVTGDAANQLQTAIDNANNWLTTHKDLRAKDDGGWYVDAVKEAVDTSVPNSAATSFANVDTALGNAINDGRQSFVDYTDDGAKALTLLAPGVAALAVVAAGGVTIGIRDRLREYR
ncbi:MAG TPA: hypothetical protein VJT49_08145 [Amycolatopsis sp.]|uniref:hypothetical protein n=1 Tax=Amycolatopsis sp. TaxID=37632 RepID=UPI002B4A52C2|nr:hypothetical protein [Amycolatopsis sp.]HKS45074.1 hypothetical protein [Amycolatopsis sp.]